MTREERVEKLRHLIKCLKCDVSGKPCDVNCPTQYSAGNMGEIIENLEEIAKVLDQELCDDAVSRKAVHDMLENLPVTVENKWFNWLQKACIRLAELPPVTPIRKKGKWLGDKRYPICPKCNCNIIEEYISCSDYAEMYKPMKFCPNCGAYMRSEEEK